MIEIELNKIKKNYGLKNILDGFSLELKTGERVALIGQNGSGKSTILKIIAKQESVDSGTINIRNGAKIGILNQIYENEKEDISVEKFLYKSFEEILKVEKKLNKLETQMSTEVNADKLEKIINEYGRMQERFSLMGGYEIQERFNKICSRFYINKELLKQSYNLLSGGEKTRVNLAKLLLTQPEILLLDEPTNHLDIHSLEFLEELILKYKGTVLIVSHDRYFLDKVINKTVLLENGKENIYYGNYSYFLKEDERRTLAQFENYKNQQKQIERMKESILTLRKFGDLAGNEMFFKRAKNIEKRLEKMEIIDRDVVELCRKIRKDEDNTITPVIVVSSKSGKEHRVRILQESIEYFIKKPVDEQYLYYTVKNLNRLLSSNRRVSPLTGLPGNVQIHAELKKRILRQEPFCVLYVDLDNFKAYNDVYGFLKGDEIIEFTAETIIKMVHSDELENTFVGHIGGDDFVAIVPGTNCEKLCQNIISYFDKNVERYFTEADIEKGYIEVANRKGIIEQFPLTSVSIGVVVSDVGRFHNILEIGEIGAQVKHAAKSVMGSSYAVDRRNL